MDRNTNNTVVGVCIAISTILVGIPLFLSCPDQTLYNTVWHKTFQIVWIICSGIVLGALLKLPTNNGNVSGTIMCVLFGPITVLTFVLIFIYLKWRNHNESSK